MTRRDEQLDTAVGQLIVGGFDGTSVPREFAELVRRGRVGGAILFSRNLSSVEGARDLLRALSTIDAPLPLLLSVDQEGGRVQRLKSPFPELPPMRVVGDKARKSLVHRLAGMLARSLRILGFHQDYAPVLDVDSNPANPIIGDRAFANDPSKVARLGASFIDGLQSNGVAACGKHFPGHGDTDVDSHLALPRLSHPRDRLMHVELAPFRSAVRAGVASIMTAHILFDALDSEHPATLSEKVLQPLLRQELGFDGVIVSDDLEMKAIADHYGIRDAAVRAIRAGCDQLLVCSKVEWIGEAHEAIVEAVMGGDLPRDRVTEAAARVDRLKRAYVFDQPGPVEGDVVSQLPTSEYEALLAELEAGPQPGPVAEIPELELEEGEDLELELDS